MTHKTSLEERVAQLARRADSILLTTDDTQQALSRYTVPLLAVPQDLSERPPLVGCGVLVRLGDLYFVLTAGHVVRKLLPEADSQFVPVFGAQRHARTCLVARRGYRYDPPRSIDFGYIEVSAVDARAWCAYEKTALGDHSIEVASAEQLQSDDYFVILGTPDALTQDDPNRFYQALSLTHWTTCLAGERNTPRSDLTTAAPGVECLDLAFDDSALGLRVMDGRLEEAPILTEIGGVSGGPCFKGNVLPDPSCWTPRSPRLVATHCGRHVGHKDDGKEFWFARETLIGHHLRLLLSDYADSGLARFLVERWPQLLDWPAFDRTHR
jgi:hypothetical protein